MQFFLFSADNIMGYKNMGEKERESRREQED